MAIFKRNTRATDAGDAVRNGSSNDADSDASSAKGLRKFAQRKPANTAFKQQRLKAWQPILTPRTVLPAFFLVAIIFAPIGAVLYYFAEQVNEFTLDYTQCSTAPATPNQAQIPASKYDYQLHDKNTSNFQSPTWSWDSATKTCSLYFSVPSRLESSVFLYYKLTNYYQNHRRYVKSLDSDQLKGNDVAYNTIQGGTCKPVDVDPNTRKIIYPCGLIANSVFNDTFGDPVLLNVAGSDSANQTYVMSEKNIIWPGEKKKYSKTKYNADQIIPPPYWQGATGQFGFANGYTQNNIFDPSDNEHFMVWMRIAGLPTFRKLYKRNDTAPMEPGRYLLQVVDNYPVAMFDGTKSVVFSTSSWVGGRNPFLGLSFIAVAALSVLLGLVFTARHLIKPRKLGDMSYLSWNQPDSK
ncbi:related to CDC50 - cell division protein [Ustilago trichophora]|uniref:Related to CDC50 - cell division protein n=1 Tax=Ustilago trichophora TaxID=86804 RepID=A0A5C3DTD9_9BASI|nr:related to CDC50 - cell division protein [Ustilago trichophora]